MSRSGGKVQTKNTPQPWHDHILDCSQSPIFKIVEVERLADRAAILDEC